MLRDEEGIRLRFGFLANSSSSHVRGMAAIGCELRKRGHDVQFLHVPDYAQIIGELGLSFRAIGEAQFPVGTMSILDGELGRMRGLDGLKYSISRSVDQAEVFLDLMPVALKTLQVDALIIDEVELYAFSVAEMMKLPYITVSLALPIVLDDSVPPYFTLWSYMSTPSGSRRNRKGYESYIRLARPLTEVVERYRRQWNLPDRTSSASRRARLASISQLPSGFDFPRIALARFYYCAPLSLSLPAEDLPFPWDQLDGRPLVYVSFGTVMSRPLELVHIVEVANDLGCQAVVSCGGASLTDLAGRIGGGNIVVKRAPQQKLIRRASLVVTHGGLNTVLESLAYGVPVLAIPFVNDQCGVAARLRWSGTGDFIRADKVTSDALKRAQWRLLSEPGFRRAAQEVALQISKVNGAVRAAHLIEGILSAVLPATAAETHAAASFRVAECT